MPDWREEAIRTLHGAGFTVVRDTRHGRLYRLGEVSVNIPRPQVVDPRTVHNLRAQIRRAINRAGVVPTNGGEASRRGMTPKEADQLTPLGPAPWERENSVIVQEPTPEAPTSAGKTTVIVTEEVSKVGRKKRTVYIEGKPAIAYIADLYKSGVSPKEIHARAGWDKTGKSLSLVNFYIAKARKTGLIAEDYRPWPGHGKRTATKTIAPAAPQQKAAQPAAIPPNSGLFTPLRKGKVIEIRMRVVECPNCRCRIEVS